jgi:predicted DNA-binding transcriptional regulator
LPEWTAKLVVILALSALHERRTTLGRIIGGVGLLLVSAFMLLGFLRADGDASLGTTLIALFVAVALPAAGGVALLSGRFRGQRQISARQDELRRQTIDAEVLRLAARYDGKLTVVEVMTELAVSQDTAKESLEALMRRDLADIEITDSGVLVYVFGDVRKLEEKARSKGVLE